MRKTLTLSSIQELHNLILHNLVDELQELARHTIRGQIGDIFQRRTEMMKEDLERIKQHFDQAYEDAKNKP